MFKTFLQKNPTILSSALSVEWKRLDIPFPGPPSAHFLPPPDNTALNCFGSKDMSHDVLTGFPGLRDALLLKD